MRKGGGKKKGSAFERTVAKMIAKAFKPFGIHQRECWRSVLSGGHKISSGDLTFSPRLAKLFPYSIECKRYKTISWERFLISKQYRKPSWQEWKWIAQAKEGLEKNDELSKWLLVLKENHGPIYAIYDAGIGIRMVEFKDFLKRAFKKVKNNDYPID